MSDYYPPCARALTRGPDAIRTLASQEGLFYEDRGIALIHDGFDLPNNVFVINVRDGWIHCVSGDRLIFGNDVCRIEPPPGDVCLDFPILVRSQMLWFVDHAIDREGDWARGVMSLVN